MNPAIVVIIVLVLALVGFLVYWFGFRTTNKPGDSCTVKSPDPNANEYQYDENLNCALYSCNDGYDVHGKSCKKQSTKPTWTETDNMGISGIGLYTGAGGYVDSINTIDDCTALCDKTSGFTDSTKKTPATCDAVSYDSNKKRCYLKSSLIPPFCLNPDTTLNSSSKVNISKC